MTQECFDYQIKRLRLRFGEKAFDAEFVKLIGTEVYSLSDEQFRKITDILIGTRTHTKHPTITDFRELRFQAEKEKFSQTTHEAVKSFDKNRPELKEILKKHGYEGCSSIKEAVELAIFKNQIKKANE